MSTESCRTIRPLPDARRVPAPPAAAREPDDLLSLHHSIGNRAFAQLVASVQRQIPSPAPTTVAAAPAAPKKDFVKDWAQSALDKLSASQKKRFEGIDWGPLDFPGTTRPLSKLDEAAIKWFREQTNVTEVESPSGNYFIGNNQTQAQQLLDAVAGSASGGGERRVNLGSKAVITKRAFDLAPADFDAFIVGKLDPNPIQGSAKMHVAAAAQFKLMYDAAKKDRVVLSVDSAYRERASEEARAKKILNRRAFAGFSPHALGLAVDFNLLTSGDPSTYTEQSTENFTGGVLNMFHSPVYKWLHQNASTYGFFPYSSEPWHWEYNPSGFAEHFFDEEPELQAKITEAADAVAAERKAAAEAAAKRKKPKPKK